RLCVSTAITSLLGTPAATSALPRHVSPALPNRTVRSILASAQPDISVKVQGWVRSTRQQSISRFWRSTTDR
ncbi:hypothetical protein B0O80DRAFT_453238, partial [Mortierella sp. GBAus27b]